MKFLGGFVTAWCKIKGNWLGWWGKKMSLMLRGGGRLERSCFVLMFSGPPAPLATRVLGLQPPLFGSVVQGTGSWPLTLTAGGKRDCAQPVPCFPCPGPFLRLSQNSSSPSWQFKNMIGGKSRLLLILLERFGKLTAAEPCYWIRGAALACFGAKPAVPILNNYPLPGCGVEYEGGFLEAGTPHWSQPKKKGEPVTLQGGYRFKKHT